MSSIKLTADSGRGTFEIKAPASSANTRVLTLPDSGNYILGGKILQVVSKTDAANYSTTSQSFQQGPQSDTFNLADTSNKVLVTINFMTYADARSGGYPSFAAAIFRGAVSSGTQLTLGSQPMFFRNPGGAAEYYSAFLSLSFLDTPGANTTYSLGFKQNKSGANTAFVYGTNGNTQIILQEVAA